MSLKNRLWALAKGVWHPSSSSVHSFVIILFLSLLLRIIYALILGNRVMEGDFISYVEDSLKIYSGNPYRPFWSPGLPLILGWTGLNWGLYPIHFTIFSLACYLLLLVGVFLTLQKLPPGYFSLFPIIFLGFSPITVHFSVVPLTQLPIAVGLVWSFYFLILSFQNPHLVPRHALAVGLILGMCILIRPSCIILFPFIGYIWYKLGRHISLMYFAVSLFVIIGSWQLRNYALGYTDVFINTSNSYNFFVGNNPYTPVYKTWWLGSHLETDNPSFYGYYEMLRKIWVLPEEKQTGEFYRQALSFIKEEPRDFGIRTINRVKTFWAADSFTGAFLSQSFSSSFWAVLGTGLDFIGFCILLWLAIEALPESYTYSPGIWLIGLLIIYPLPYYLAFSHPTYHFPLLPFLCILASKGLKRQTLFSIRKKSLGLWFLRAIFVLIQIEWCLRYYYSPIQSLL